MTQLSSNRHIFVFSQAFLMAGIIAFAITIKGLAFSYPLIGQRFK